MYAGASIPTEEFPSGTEAPLPPIDVTQKNPQNSIEELLEMSEVCSNGCVRYGNNHGRTTGVNRPNSIGTVPAALILMADGTSVGQQDLPGCLNNPSLDARVRTMLTYEYRRLHQRLICYLCYAIGHVSRSCQTSIPGAMQLAHLDGRGTFQPQKCEHAKRSAVCE